MNGNGGTNTTPGHDADVQKDVKELQEINKQQEERIHKLETKALQLTNLYFVFQGVILTTISTKSIRCDISWIPFVLSLLAAILNTTALCHTIWVFLKCSEEHDQNLEDLRVMNEMKLTRAEFQEQQRDPRPNPDRIAQNILRVFSIIIVILFFGFSAVILIGCFAVRC